jgi:hypothetical protein
MDDSAVGNDSAIKDGSAKDNRSAQECHARGDVSADDDGYFPRSHSLLRIVHEEKAVGLMYGQRALCVGAVKPLNYVGTSEHTRNKRTPFRRITHTGGMFEAVFFGSRAQADRVLAVVDGMHERVVGELPRDAGPHYPAGTPYSAFDPDLMLWTVAVIADSAEWFYDRLVRPLTNEQREGLWQDYLRFAELFKMPRSSAPATHREYPTCTSPKRPATWATHRPSRSRCPPTAGSPSACTTL